MRNSEVLDRTADVIEERGWTKGRKGWEDNPLGKLCLEGGLACALGIALVEVGSGDLERLQSTPAYRALQEYLGTTRQHGLARYLWWWNDHEADATRVIEVLRGAAAVERLKEHNALTITPVSPVAVDA